MKVFRFLSCRMVFGPKEILAIFLGFILLAIGLVTAQFIFDRTGEFEIPAEITQENSSVEYYDTTSRIYGWTLRPDLQVEVNRFQGHWPIYKYAFKTDQYGRRVVRSYGEGERKKFLVLLGCSVTMGQGLKDEETLDFQLTNRLKEYHSYNYAVPGYGLGHVLAQANNINFSQQVREKEGLIIYLFPTYHVDRFLGGLETITWAGGLPYFRWEGNHLIRDGFIHEKFPIISAIKRLYSRSFLRRKYFFSWPFQTRQGDLEKACRAISEVRTSVLGKLSGGRFLLALHPHSFGNDLTFCLGKYGIEWLDARDALRGYRREDVEIKGDAHPTGLANRLITEKIVSYLHSKESAHDGTGH